MASSPVPLDDTSTPESVSPLTDRTRSSPSCSLATSKALAPDADSETPAPAFTSTKPLVVPIAKDVDAATDTPPLEEDTLKSPEEPTSTPPALALSLMASSPVPCLFRRVIVSDMPPSLSTKIAPAAPDVLAIVTGAPLAPPTAIAEAELVPTLMDPPVPEVLAPASRTRPPPAPEDEAPPATLTAPPPTAPLPAPPLMCTVPLDAAAPAPPEIVTSCPADDDVAPATTETAALPELPPI